MKYTFILLVLFIIISLGLSGIALFRSEFLKEDPADAGGFGVSPPVIRAGTLKAGESYGTTITALRSENGTVQRLSTRVAAQGFEDWVILNPTPYASFETNAFQAPITISINVPADARPGEYQGQVFLNNIPNAKSNRGVGIVLGARVDLAFTVPGETENSEQAASSTSVLLNDSERYQSLKGSIIMRGTAAPAWYVALSKPELIPFLDKAASFRDLQNSASLVEKYVLNYIPVGIIKGGQKDSDADGLPDALELAMGTNPDNFDTDLDAYSDLYEIENGFSPFVPGTVSMTNYEYAGSFTGQILWAKEDKANYWYVSPKDSKRYLICRDCNIDETFMELADPLSQTIWDELD